MHAKDIRMKQGQQILGLAFSSLRHFSRKDFSSEIPSLPSSSLVTLRWESTASFVIHFLCLHSQDEDRLGSSRNAKPKIAKSLQLESHLTFGRLPVQSMCQRNQSHRNQSQRNQNHHLFRDDSLFRFDIFEHIFFSWLTLSTLNLEVYVTILLVHCLLHACCHTRSVRSFSTKYNEISEQREETLYTPLFLFICQNWMKTAKTCNRAHVIRSVLYVLCTWTPNKNEWN